MHGCQSSGRTCAVHQVAPERYRRAYMGIILYQYSRKVVDEWLERSNTIMLEDDQVRVLDEETQEVIDQAAASGRYYADKAAAWVDMTFKISAE